MIVLAAHMDFRDRCLKEACRLLALTSGGFLTIVGVIVTVAPLPFGAVLMALGLVVLISASPTVAHLLRHARSRAPSFDRALSVLARVCPDRIVYILRKTEPLQPRAVLVRATP